MTPARPLRGSRRHAGRILECSNHVAASSQFWHIGQVVENSTVVFTGNLQRYHAIEWRHAMILCDLCGQGKECRQWEIDGKEYDICHDCSNPLAEKLKGKGRVIPEPIHEEPKPPREPPKIWGGLSQ